MANMAEDIEVKESVTESAEPSTQDDSHILIVDDTVNNRYYGHLLKSFETISLMICNTQRR